jgi:hypothetical protein
MTKRTNEKKSPPVTAGESSREEALSMKRRQLFR